ncbi:MAG: transporter [Oxalobacter formigenes]|nr:transporter [Oxalobacter formigenes]
MKAMAFIKNWTLPLAMIAGAAGFPVLVHLSPLTPFLIFTMLFLTFCRVPFSAIHFRMLHGWLLALQIGGAIAVYYALAPFNILAAEGAMVCVMAPTATAAAVITDKLGGSAASITGYTLLSNLATAIAAPLFFPAVHPIYGGLDFWEAFFLIFRRVLPLLVAPFVAAVCLRRFFPQWNARIAARHEASFYLWALALMIVMAQTTHTVIHEPAEGLTEIWIALSALAVCCLQFFLGKRIGAFYGGKITGGQALGQKNTILAVWMAHTYMTPITAVGPGAYVLWQNIINSWQLWQQRKEEERGITREKEQD